MEGGHNVPLPTPNRRKVIMKVKMLIKISGTRDGQDWPEVGGEIDLPKAEAEQMIANGQVEKAPAAKKAPAKK